jgi:MFS family permease
MIGVYIFYNLIYALLSYPVGIIADKLGLKRILVAGLLIFAGVYTSMGFADRLWQFGIIFSFYAFYAAATEGVSKALISNISAKADTATAIGFYTSLASICTLLASSLAGLLWFNYGPKVMFLVSGAGVFCVVLYFAILKHNELKPVI